MSPIINARAHLNKENNRTFIPGREMSFDKFGVPNKL